MASKSDDPYIVTAPGEASLFDHYLAHLLPHYLSRGMDMARSVDLAIKATKEVLRLRETVIPPQAKALEGL